MIVIISWIRPRSNDRHHRMTPRCIFELSFTKSTSPHIMHVPLTGGSVPSGQRGSHIDTAQTQPQVREKEPNVSFRKYDN
jgi:hypothetical protein